MRPRVELFFKTEAELRSRLRMLTDSGYASFNLVNKDAKDPVDRWVDVCCEALGPGQDVCAHFSTKYNGRGGPGALRSALGARLARLAAKAGESGVGLSALVVSGSGARKTGMRAADVVGDLADPAAPVGVAFNPYLDGADERAALAAKCASGAVSSVWLQFGTDVERLDRELAWLKATYPKIDVVGSVFLPTKKLIAQQKFRPWAGVALSDEYLSGPEGAERATRALLEVYRTHGVRPLVEAPGVRTAKDLAVVEELFAAAPGEPAPAKRRRRAAL